MGTRNPINTLLPGTHISHASFTISLPEVESLRGQAIRQALCFRILESEHLDVLSRNSQGLDEHYEYLRRTCRVLRARKQIIHQNLAAFLGKGCFCIEAFLSYQADLAIIDNSIDDWVAKLEVLESGRSCIRTKLLEHIAAVLLMSQSFKAG